MEATKAVILATIEPMLATFAAWWLWGEFFSPVGWVGAALIMAAVFLIIFEGSKAPKAGQPTDGMPEDERERAFEK